MVNVYGFAYRLPVKRLKSIAVEFIRINIEVVIVFIKNNYLIILKNFLLFIVKDMVMDNGC